MAWVLLPERHVEPATRHRHSLHPNGWAGCRQCRPTATRPPAAVCGAVDTSLRATRSLSASRAGYTSAARPFWRAAPPRSPLGDPRRFASASKSILSWDVRCTFPLVKCACPCPRAEVPSGSSSARGSPPWVGSTATGWRADDDAKRPPRPSQASRSRRRKRSQVVSGV